MPTLPGDKRERGKKLKRFLVRTAKEQNAVRNSVIHRLCGKRFHPGREQRRGGRKGSV